jgi:hypothetical protein
MARAALDPKASETSRDIARAEFLDVGVPEEHVDAMMDWLVQHEDHPTLDDLNSEAGQIYERAILRYTDQTIQNPRRADKPAAVASPIGRVIYALTPFLYAFFQNVHVATKNRTLRNYSIARGHGESIPTAAAGAAVTPLTALTMGFGTIFLGQLLATMAREAIFNQEQWEKKDDEERRRWLAQVALSRTGVFGPGDVLVNAMTGLRYERDLTSLGVGAGAAYGLSQVQNILNGLPRTELWEGGPGVGLRNSPNTNSAERTAAKALYRLIVAPAFAMGLSALRADGALSWPLRYAGLTYLTSNSAAASFADTVAGEKEKKPEDELD